MRKIIALAGGVLATVVLVPTVVVTNNHIVRPGLADWLQVSPVVLPVVALLSAVLLWRSGNKGPVRQGVAWGFFGGLAAYMCLQALILSTQYAVISQDGTAYWAMLHLPADWIALPLIPTATAIGAFVGGLVKRKRTAGPQGER